MKHLPILAILPFLPLALFAKDSYKVEVFTYSPASAQSATNFLNKMSTDELRKDILNKATWIQSATRSIPIGVKGTASKVSDESDVYVKKLLDAYRMAEYAYDISPVKLRRPIFSFRRVIAAPRVGHWKRPS